jgi:hypothetical protein
MQPPKSSRTATSTAPAAITTEKGVRFIFLRFIFLVAGYGK